MGAVAPFPTMCVRARARARECIYIIGVLIEIDMK